MNKTWIIIGLVVLLFIGFLIWLFIASSQPLPGQKIDDLGRGHVQIGTEVDYSSNPPTSGKHYEDWIRAGVYDGSKDDRNLVHSLEHGYVIMSYNCDKLVSLPFGGPQFPVSKVYAHGIEEEATQSSEVATSGQLSESFRSEECHKLVDQFISIYEKKGKTRLCS